MRIARLAAWVGAGLIAAVLANGAVPFLKRVGGIEQASYSHFRAAFCSPKAGAPCLCMRQSMVLRSAANPEAPSLDEVPDRQYIYDSPGYQRAFKFAKELLFAGFALLSLYLIKTRRAAVPAGGDAWPVWLLVANVGAGWLVSMALWGLPFALVGLRSFEFLAVALLGAWTASGLRTIARCLVLLLIAQVALVLVELLLGIPLRTCPHSFRAAGTMVLSNSLGALTIVALAFYRAFSPHRPSFWGLALVAAALLMASGSGTGWLALFVLLSTIALEKLDRTYKLLAGLGLLMLAAALLVELPTLTHRPDIYESVFSNGGRVGTMRSLLDQTSTTQQLFGRGIGFGTNTASNLSNGVPAPLPAAEGTKFSADSTVIVLFTQLGLLGVVLFYGLLAWAYRRDPLARPAYLVIAIVSLTINLPEVFPINFLFGLMLAHTLASPGRAQAMARR